MRIIRFRQSSLILWAVLASAFAAPAAAESPDSLFKRLSPSIVIVDSKNEAGGSIAQGSGVVIKHATVITNWHVVKEGSVLIVRLGSKKFEASVQYSDPARDLCQLKVNGLNAPEVPLGSVKGLEVGQKVIAIGAPKGLELTLTDGLISSLRPEQGSDYIQISAPISPGSSGGGLFDENGRLIGITAFQVKDGQNLNFALPIDWVKAIAGRSKQSSTKKSRSQGSFQKQIEQLLADGNARAALRLARAHTEENPKDKWGWFNIGAAQNMLGKFGEAVDSFERALEIDSKFALALRNEGVAYLQLGRKAEAERALIEAIQIRQTDPTAYILLGGIQFQKEDYDSAIGSFSKAVSLDPTNAEYLGSLGMGYQGAGDNQRAVEYLESALKINPMGANNWDLLGLSCYKLGRTKEMNQAFDNAKLIKRGERPVEADFQRFNN